MRDGREHNTRVAHSDDHLQPPVAAEGDHYADELTDVEREFIKLDRRKAEVKKFFDEYAEAVKALVAAHGVGHCFQDDEGVVYETAEVEGKFVYFERHTVNRTKREGEAKGTLAVKTARERGFEVK